MKRIYSEEHGEGVGFVIYPYPNHIHTSIEDMITSINTMGFRYVYEGIEMDGIQLETSPELNMQLIDIPENQANFDKLWGGVPPYFMQFSKRTEINDKSYFTVFGDYNCDEAKAYANKIFGKNKK